VAAGETQSNGRDADLGVVQVREFRHLGAVQEEAGDAPGLAARVAAELHGDAVPAGFAQRHGLGRHGARELPGVEREQAQGKAAAVVAEPHRDGGDLVDLVPADDDAEPVAGRQVQEVSVQFDVGSEHLGGWIDVVLHPTRLAEFRPCAESEAPVTGCGGNNLEGAEELRPRKGIAALEAVAEDPVRQPGRRHGQAQGADQQGRNDGQS
jgi:hypothetical protein